MVVELEQGSPLVRHSDLCDSNLRGILSSAYLACRYRNFCANVARLLPVEDVHAAIRFEARKVEHVGEGDLG